MKEALIVSALAGFVKSFLINDIHLLQKHGFHVTCAANANHPGADGVLAFFESEGVDFVQIDFSSNRPFSNETFSSFWQLKSLFKCKSFDLVHCHTPIAGALCRIACRRLRKAGTKVIYTTHGFYFHKSGDFKSWALFYPIEWLCSGFCDAIVTINSEDFTVAKRMRCRKVFHMNGMGVDIDRFWKNDVDCTAIRSGLDISPNDIVVLSVGELSKRKNQKIVVEALSLLHRPDVVLLHCGNAMNDLNTKDEVLQAAKSGGVRLLMLGLRSDVPDLCKIADIGTLSSTREGLGLAGIEMLASGLPLVASSVHGIKDYVKDGVNGYLANPYDARSFARGIENYSILRLGRA